MTLKAPSRKLKGMSQHSLLLIDDEVDITDALERQFRKKYKIFKANTGIDGLKILRKEKISLIISDQRMPQMTGVEFFEQAQHIQPEAVRILLTGYTDVGSVIASINAGHIYRYVTKPWDPNDLEVAVQRGIDTFELKNELKEKNETLEKALADLKVLDVAKSHFMILIGHELKTPLTTLNSFLGLLKEESDLSKDATKYIQRIEQAGNRLQEIVFDVLDLMAAETGQMPVNPGKTNLKEIAETALGKHQNLIKKKSLKVENDLGKTGIQADAKILTKVFDKIIHNALKFADDETTVKIGAKELQGKFKLFVENKGPELSKKTIDKILKPFTLDEDIMHHSQGLGLGLSLCQALLKRHGSTLQIESSSGKTSVGFTL